MSDPTTIHRALADRRRTELVTALEQAVEALDASELGRRVGLHANTVRWHLGILEDAGLVSSHADHRGTPGRPRRVWKRTRLADHDEAGEHRALARALVSVVAGRPEAVADAEAAGRAWGRRVAWQAEPAADGVDAVTAVLGEHGFEPETDGLVVSMRRCPFADVARESPDVICGLHRGLVEGVLDAVGSALRVDELRILPSPGLCVLRLRRPV